MGGWRPEPGAPPAPSPPTPRGAAPAGSRSSAWRAALAPLREAPSRRPTEPLPQLLARCLAVVEAAGGAAALTSDLSAEALGADLILLCRAATTPGNSACDVALLDTLAGVVDDVSDRRGASFPSPAAGACVAALSRCLSSRLAPPVPASPPPPPTACLRALACLLQEHGGSLGGSECSSLLSLLSSFAHPQPGRPRAPRLAASRLALTALSTLVSRAPPPAAASPPAFPSSASSTYSHPFRPLSGAQPPSALARVGAAIASEAGGGGATPASALPSKPPPDDAASASFFASAFRAAAALVPEPRKGGGGGGGSGACGSWEACEPSPQAVAALLSQARRFLIYGLPPVGCAPHAPAWPGSSTLSSPLAADNDAADSGSETDGGADSGYSSSAAASSQWGDRGITPGGAAAVAASRCRAAACRLVGALSRYVPRSVHPHWPALLRPTGGGPPSARASLPGVAQHDSCSRARASACAALFALFDGAPNRTFLFSIATSQPATGGVAAAASLSAQVAAGAEAACASLAAAMACEQSLPCLVAACRAAAAFAHAAPFARLSHGVLTSLAGAAAARAEALSSPSSSSHAGARFHPQQQPPSPSAPAAALPWSRPRGSSSRGGSGAAEDEGGGGGGGGGIGGGGDADAARLACFAALAATFSTRQPSPSMAAALDDASGDDTAADAPATAAIASPFSSLAASDTAAATAALRGCVASASAVARDASAPHPLRSEALNVLRAACRAYPSSLSRTWDDCVVPALVFCVAGSASSAATSSHAASARAPSDAGDGAPPEAKLAAAALRAAGEALRAAGGGAEATAKDEEEGEEDAGDSHAAQRPPPVPPARLAASWSVACAQLLLPGCASHHGAVRVGALALAAALTPPSLARLPLPVLQSVLSAPLRSLAPDEPAAAARVAACRAVGASARAARAFASAPTAPSANTDESQPPLDRGSRDAVLSAAFLRAAGALLDVLAPRSSHHAPLPQPPPSATLALAAASATADVCATGCFSASSSSSSSSSSTSAAADDNLAASLAAACSSLALSPSSADKLRAACVRSLGHLLKGGGGGEAWAPHAAAAIAHALLPPPPPPPLPQHPPASAAATTAAPRAPLSAAAAAQCSLSSPCLRAETLQTLALPLASILHASDGGDVSDQSARQSQQQIGASAKLRARAAAALGAPSRRRPPAAPPPWRAAPWRAAASAAAAAAWCPEEAPRLRVEALHTLLGLLAAAHPPHPPLPPPTAPPAAPSSQDDGATAGAASLLLPPSPAAPHVLYCLALAAAAARAAAASRAARAAADAADAFAGCGGSGGGDATGYDATGGATGAPPRPLWLCVDPFGMASRPPSEAAPASPGGGGAALPAERGGTARNDGDGSADARVAADAETLCVGVDCSWTEADVGRAASALLAAAELAGCTVATVDSATAERLREWARADVAS